MIKHIVFWKLKNDNNNDPYCKIKNELENLKNIIPEIVSIEVGKNTNSNDYDLALLSEFKNSQDLLIYQEHPEHIKIRNFINSICEKRACIDYEI